MEGGREGVMGGGKEGEERGVCSTASQTLVLPALSVREIGASLQHHGQTGRHLEACTQEH
jgi:hypothetical protein